MYYEEKKRVLSEDDEVRSLWKAAIQEYCEYVKAFRGSCFNVYLNKAVRFVLYHVVPRGRIEASSMKDEIEGYKSRCKEFMEKASGTNHEQENEHSLKTVKDGGNAKKEGGNGNSRPSQELKEMKKFLKLSAYQFNTSVSGDN